MEKNGKKEQKWKKGQNWGKGTKLTKLANSLI